MIVTYRPDGGTEQTWPYRPDDFPYEDAERIEDVLDYSFEDFKGKVFRGDMRARKALVWVLLRRDNPKMRFSDFQPKSTKEIAVDYERAEIAEMRETALKNDDADPDDVAGFLKALDSLEFDDIAAQTAAEDPDPKDPDPSASGD